MTRAPAPGRRTGPFADSSRHRATKSKPLPRLTRRPGQRLAVIPRERHWWTHGVSSADAVLIGVGTAQETILSMGRGLPPGSRSVLRPWVRAPIGRRRYGGGGSYARHVPARGRLLPGGVARLRVPAGARRRVVRPSSRSRVREVASRRPPATTNAHWAAVIGERIAPHPDAAAKRPAFGMCAQARR
jgi:hypothetical protein